MRHLSTSGPAMCRSRVILIGFVAGLVAFSGIRAPLAGPDAPDKNELGTLELELKSKYSHIRIRRNGSVRTLIFVADNGAEARESQIDSASPHVLHFPYLRYMFLSYLFRPEPEKVLIVGLGGGSMVHFLNRYDPRVEVDAVEIDPEVVRIADEYFGVRNRNKETDKVQVKIITADGLEYLKDTQSRYDVIYLDAFLKPATDNDDTGVPLRLRTRDFYKRVQAKLKPDGLVVFNLHTHRGSDEDMQAIRDSFAQVYTFSVSSRSGRVIVASPSSTRLSRTEILERARSRDSRNNPGFSFEEMARDLE